MRSGTEPLAPSWADYRAGGERRRLWRNYWYRDVFPELLQWALFHLYSVLPIPLVSFLGQLVSTNIIPRLFPNMIVRTMINLRWLLPDKSEEELQAIVRRQFAELGRLHSEYSIMHRLMAAGRIRLVNAELATESVKRGPVIFVGVHTGNFETIGQVGKHLGIPALFTYEPQPSPMHNHLRRKVWARNSAPGSMAVPPGPAFALEALRWLRRGKPVMLYCDDAVHGTVVAPLFGHPPRVDSNYAIAARLARVTNATILPFHVVRTKGCRFTVTFGPVIELPPTEDARGALMGDVARMNAVIEPFVRAHLEQWYWLNWPIPGRNYP